MAIHGYLLSRHDRGDPRAVPGNSVCTYVTILATLFVAVACATRLVPDSRSPSPTVTIGPGALVLVGTLHSGPSLSGATAVAGEGSCRGTATVTIDPNPSGTLNLATAVFQISLVDCPAGTTLTSVHVHRMPIGTVEEWIGSDLPEAALRNGQGDLASVNRGVPIARARAVIDDPTNFYIHFHSRNNPAGFLRGELAPR
jgi:CHRD domain-containing protein